MKFMSPYIFPEYRRGKTRCWIYSLNSASAYCNPTEEGLSYPCSPGHRSRPPRRSPRDRCSSWGRARKYKRRLSRKEARSCGSCSPGSSGIESYCRETTTKGAVLLFPASISTAPCLRLKGAFPKLAICK